MREALEERVQSGRFDKEWTRTQSSGEQILEELMTQVSQHPIVKSEKQLHNTLGGANERDR